MLEQDQLVKSLWSSGFGVNKTAQGLGSTEALEDIPAAGESLTANLLWPEQMQGLVERRKRVINIQSASPMYVHDIQFPQGFAIFRKKGNEVVINEHGAFVPLPKALFDPSDEVSYGINRTPEGRPTVTLFSRPSDERGEVVPRTRVEIRRTEQVDASRETRWLAEHGREYAGQWVALDGDRLLAHGESAREVYEAVHASEVRLPLVVLVEADDESLPFGGW